MDTTKKETFKIKRESHQVSQKTKDNQKAFNTVKKKILEAFKDEELTIPQISAKIGMNETDTLYYVMSLLKFGSIQVSGIDDMDEFYIYKIKK